MMWQAGESGDYAVALGVRPAGAEVTVLGPDRRRRDGPGGANRRHSCPFVWAGVLRSAGSSREKSSVSGSGGELLFRLPARALSGERACPRATNAFRKLRSVDYTERLASSPRDKVVSEFTLERPDRLSVPNSWRRRRDHHRHAALGSRARRQVGALGSETLTPEPEPIWAGQVTNAYLLESTPTTYVVSFFKPIGPAWFTVQPRSEDVAAAQPADDRQPHIS